MQKQEPTIKDVMSGLNIVHKELCGLNHKVTGIEEIVDGTKEEMTEMRGEMTEMRGEMTEMRGEMTEMRGEMTEMKEDITYLKRGVAEVNVKIDRLQEDVIEMGGAMTLFAQNVDERFVKVDGEFKEMRKELSNRTSRVLVV